jgi:hypothetical protein
MTKLGKARREVRAAVHQHNKGAGNRPTPDGFDGVMEAALVRRQGIAFDGVQSVQVKLLRGFFSIIAAVDAAAACMCGRMRADCPPAGVTCRPAMRDNAGAILFGIKAIDSGGAVKIISGLQVAVCMVAVSLSTTVCAQTYPATHVRIITAAAGGGSDFATRLIAGPLAAALGQQVIVENRGLLAADVAAKAPADGYTLLLSGQTLWLLPFMRDHVASNVTDFTPITTATETVNILLVHPSLPAKSVRELIDLARARPGQLNFATSGNGSSVHIAAELFKSMAGINVQRINYKGASQALTELISGQTQFMFGVPGSVVPHIKAGRLRALAISGAKPSPLMPGLPPVAQTVPGYEVASRLALFAPAGTPASIVTRLNREVVRVLNRSDVKNKFNESQIEIVGDTPEQLAAMIKAEIATTAKIIKEAGIRAE